MAEQIAPNRRPAIGIAAIAAIISGSVALLLAIEVTLLPDFIDFPIAPSLLVFGLTGLAFGLREMSVRAQFAAQADSLSESLWELKDKNRLLNLTELSAKVGHWRLNFDDDKLFWSYGTFKMHGLKPGSVPTLEEAVSYYHPDDIEIIEEAVEAARQHGTPYNVSARLIRADGEVRHIECRGEVELGTDAKPAYLFGMIRDRTDEELSQQDLMKARDDAKNLAQSKGIFLARMSHEIRTPMNGVLGFAELLGRSKLDPEQKRHTDFIVESGKSLQSLLNDILDLSKIEAGKIEVNPGTVDVLHLVYRVTQLAEVSAREKNIKLAYDIAPDVPRHVVLDALRVRQVLSNLLSNAVRFTDEGGVSVSLRCVEGKLRFAVCDTGTGISPRMIEEIFDPFTQERNGTTNSRGGTGLGLAISRQLAELMGGQLSVRSELGKGSVFTLTLPLIGAAAPPETRDDTGVTANTTLTQAESRVLLAEDYDINRELITEMTRQLGVEVECAEDGMEAVAMVKHARECGSPYTLVLMDLQMPRLDGLEATRELRNDGIGEDELPILALTANAFADDVENCLAAGMQAHLAKPLSMDRLAEALKKWMPNNEDTLEHSARYASSR